MTMQSPTVRTHTEQEWQFSTQDLQPARHWLATQPHETSQRRLIARPTLALQDTYYDSADWMIFRAGYALRLRQSREADAASPGETELTLKSLRPAAHGLARRQEISQPVADADLNQVLAHDGGLAGRIRDLAGSRALVPLFQVRTRRERHQLLEADSELPLAEVGLDETSIESSAGASRELRRVEVECLNAEPGALGPWVEQLRDAAHLQPAEASKFRAGLETAGLAPQAVATPGDTAIHAAQPFAQAQLAILRSYFSRLQALEPPVRAGSAVALHEMRVACRHLDTMLRAFRGYGPRWAVASRGRLHGLVKALGAVRDVDVQLEFLDQSTQSFPDELRSAAEPLRVRLAAQHRRARQKLLRVLDSPPVRAWIGQWQQELAAPAAGSTRALRGITAVVARDLIRGQARKLRKRARKLDAQSAAADFHAVRIRTKRLRYTVEAFAALHGEAAQEYLRALADLQSVLGAYQDSEMREQRFVALVKASPRLPADATFLVGRLVERDARDAAHLRKGFDRAWRRASGRRWRELRAVLKSVAQTATAQAEQAPR